MPPVDPDDAYRQPGPPSGDPSRHSPSVLDFIRGARQSIGLRVQPTTMRSVTGFYRDLYTRAAGTGGGSRRVVVSPQPRLTSGGPPGGRRGRRSNRQREAQLLGSPNRAFEEKAKAARTTQRRRDASAIDRDVALRRGALSGQPLTDAMAISGIAFNQWLWDAKFAAGRRERILRIGRTGAAATRPFQPTAVPGRTGAAATRSPSTSPAPAELPARQPAVTPQPGQRPASAPAPQTQPMPVPRPSPVARPSPAPAQSLFRLPDLGEMLQRALAPRTAPRPAAARVARPLPARVVSPRPTLATIPGALASPGLTPFNSPVLGFAQGLQPSPTPREDTDECECKPKRKKDTKPRCRNPVISRRKDGDVLTTKTRITCPPSRPRLR